MGVVWSSGRLTEAFNGVGTAFMDSVEDKAHDIGQQGAQQAKAFTASRPSAKSGKAGRVETGKMMEAISYRVTRNGPYQVLLEMGFTDFAEPYFVYQTSTGFRHNRSGEFIAPTLAVVDAGRIMEAQVPAILRSSIKLMFRG